MFNSRFFANRYFAPRYFPKVGADPVQDVGDFTRLNHVQGSVFMWVSGGVNHIMRAR